MQRLFSYAACGLLWFSSAVATAEEELFVAKPFSPGWTTGIEGPACDAEGNVYAVNYSARGTIGRATPDGKTEDWIALPNKSVGNGIRFDRAGMMYVADYANHNILQIDPKTKEVKVFAHEDTMHQPNDLAIGPDGTLYASDPDWGKEQGQVWRIGKDGKISLLVKDLGTSNGVEVSPDGKTLYVNESVQRNVWAIPLHADGSAGEKKLVKQFEDHGFDGMRCDVEGNLYVTRYGKGTVAVLTPAGEVIREIDVLGKSPSNLCFGGPDGCTVYVTEVDHKQLVSFRTDKPGQSWKIWQDAKK